MANVRDGDPVDVLVIGAGASGAVAASALVDAGFTVACLEQGEWPDRESFPGDKLEWELLAGKPWSMFPGVRARWEDYPVDASASDIGAINWNGVGGGTVLYGAQWPRLTPADFRVRTLDGVADDWPISYDELLPYYEITDRQMGVSGLGGNPVYPPGADPPLPPLPIGRAGMLVARRLAALGWHWWPEPNAILSATYDGRRPCVQRGTCQSGCNEGAKGSTDLTHWPHAIAAGARLVTGARVTRITIDGSGLATGAEWLDRSGNQRFQAARVVLCAGNGIGTPRLLLLSACSRFPDGLANSSGLVGRNLMMHPLALVNGLFTDDFEGWRGQAGGLLTCLEHYHSDATRGFVRGAKWTLMTATGPMRPLFFDPTENCWGADHHRFQRERLGRTATWAMVFEDLPELENRVELSTTTTDSSGLAAPSLVYRRGENTTRLVEWNIARGMEFMTGAGAHKVEVLIPPANGHFLGTARMGDDPATSVVDRWCMSHDVPNLGIIDGSVFVTAGAMNPTSTICALALRAAQHIVDTRTDLPVPTHSAPVALATNVRITSPPVDDSGEEPAPPPTLSPAQRATFASLADLLIPATDGMPAASSVGVADDLVDRVLEVRADLAAPLVSVLDGARSTAPDAAIDELAAGDGRALFVLRYVVAGAYYLSADVRDRLGYPGPDPRVVSPSTYGEYVDEGLLDHVVGQ
jgi:choline dehydrogenase-like flavoprotein